ncbi:serine hydrolase [Enterococcus nangangensis]|uniref:serine hydrolase n=1 Tax=Enterococcus nangangensis TaxID=2559926 RepID=UPI0010F6BB37|nr:serine hydrolase [Enterococcus nangangensis]
MRMRGFDVLGLGILLLIFAQQIWWQQLEASNLLIAAVLAIAGYLMTGLTLEHVKKQGKFYLGHYLLKGIKSIFVPLALLALIGGIWAYCWQPSVLADFSHQLFASFGCVLNIYQLFTDTSTGVAAPQLFSSLWPLANLCQLTVIWGLVLWFLEKIRPKGKKAAPFWFATAASLTLLTFGGSIAFSLLASSSSLLYLPFMYAPGFLAGSALSCLLGVNEETTMLTNFSRRYSHSRLIFGTGGALGLLVLAVCFFPNESRGALMSGTTLGWLVALVLLFHGRLLADQQKFRLGNGWWSFLLASYCFFSGISIILLPQWGVLLGGSVTLLLSLAGGLGVRFLARHYRQLSLGKERLVVLGTSFLLLGFIYGGVGSSRLHADATATTATAEEVTTTSTSVTPPINDVTTFLLAAWQPLLAQATGQADIAVYDHTSGLTYHLTNNGLHTTFETASIVKVSVASLYMKSLETGALTVSEDDEVELKYMIEQSDNEATTYLLKERLGGFASLSTLFTTLGMTDSHYTEESWGLTTTTALDQITLLNMLAYNEGNYLSLTSREKILALMGNVDSEQDWGISVGAPAFQIKNGWLDRSDGTWVINSIGHVYDPTNEKTDYTIAVLSKNNDSELAGITLVEELAAATAKLLINN